MNGEISSKIGKVIAMVGLALIFILLRVCYLASFRHEEYVEKARRPQRRTVIEPIGRASIRDRFNLPLAINKVQFKAAIRYADIREVPAFRYETNAEGKRTKIPLRTKYIESLAQKLGAELGVNARDIEDTIHAKAALLPHVPFVIAESINEEQYFRLRMMEKDWPGVVAQRDSKRHYPYGKVACDVIGMMGAISSEEYKRITEHIKELQAYIDQREEGKTPFLPKGYLSPLDVREKLIELKRKAYTLRDLVGKSGIESAFDQELKGSSGKHFFEVSVKGNILRELPMNIAPVPGKRVILTLSAELQSYAEALLARAEARRCKLKGSLAEPWIKGGAIVAMDAKTGEILALASTPRFDPSDFLPNSERRHVLKWLENETWIAELWDGHAKMNREFFFAKSGFETEELSLTWKHFKEAVLPSKGETKIFFDSIDTLEKIFSLQTGDKREDFLFIDLSRLVARREEYPLALQAKLGALSCDEFYQIRQAYLRLKRKVEQESRKLFSKTIFEEWREKRFKPFLKIKRSEEKKEMRTAKPYTEYLEERKRTMFKEFWAAHHLFLMEALLMDRVAEGNPFFKEIASSLRLNLDADKDLKPLCALLPNLTAIERKALLKSFKSYKELSMPLLGSYPRVRKEKGKQTLKHLAASFYPMNGYGFGRSQAFRQSTPAGSVFKLVIAYQALLEKYEKLKQEQRSLSLLNPLVLTDDSPQHGVAPNLVLGRTEEGKPITRLYKGGRLPRSSHAGIGKIDLIGAIEQSSNIYFSLLAAEHIQERETLAQVARQFGYGEMSGIELPGEIPGALPKDLDVDKTAIYAYAIGQHSLVVTPLQTAGMVGAVTSGGKVIKPSVVQFKAGQEMGQDPAEIFERSDFAQSQIFADVGIHFPVFTLSQQKNEPTSLSFSPIQIRKSLFIPNEIREVLLEGMKKTVHGARGTARPGAVRGFCFDEGVYRDYLSVLPKIAGKTGTAEILYRHSIDLNTKAILRKHTWFAGASFAKDKTGAVNWSEPEVIVVVYLRFSDAGREAAPLAGLMIKKWEEICSKWGHSSYVRAPIDDRLN